MDRLPPEPGGFQDIGLVDADDLLAALAGRLKRDAGDPLDLHHAVAFGIIGLRAVLAIAAAPLAEVDAAGQLPDHHQVKAVGDDIGPQRAITCQGRVEFCGAQIRIKAQGRPQTEQRLFRAQGCGILVPLWAADGAQQDTVRRQAAVDRLLGQGLPAGVDGAATGKIAGERKFMAEFLADGL